MAAVAEMGDPAVAVAARRTESLDTQWIMKLATDETLEIFGRVNVVQLIEKANLAVTLLDETSTIIGHASFADYPSIDTNKGDWESWIKENYTADKYNALNTLFLKYFVSKGDFKCGSLKEILRTVFSAIPFLHFILVTVPSDVDLGNVYGSIFDAVPLKDSSQSTGITHKMYCCQRQEYCPMLHIRKARVEDYDDLMPIFDRHNNQLREIYGDFFLSELIEAQDENNKSFVADVDGTAVGFISVSTDVNTDILNECFELGPFSGLKTKRGSMNQNDQGSIDNIKVQNLGEKRSESLLSKGSATALSAPSPSSPTSDRPGGLKSPAKGGKRMNRIKSPLPDQSGSRTPQSPISRPGTSLLTPEPDQEPRRDQRVYSTASKGSDSDKDDLIPSAMSIQLFCIDERYEMRSIDFLLAVFEGFQSKDFLVITIPHTVPEFPLLQVFKRITPKPDCILTQELYVFHRYGLLSYKSRPYDNFGLSNFIVRHCCSEDQQGITKLLVELNAKTDLLSSREEFARTVDVSQYNKARRDQDGTEIQAFVAECQGQIVGVCLLRQEEDIEYTRAHYNIEDFVYFNQHERNEHARLFHFVLNPIFSHYGRHFMKEILRLAGKSCLYFALPPPYARDESIKPSSIVTCLPDLVPIKARRQILYPIEELGINAPSERILKNKISAVYHFNRKLTFEPKVVVNVRIVVVGGSDTGFSCLEALAFCPHLRFNNLILLTPDPLPETLSPDDEGHSFFPSRLCFSKKDYATLALKTWVNVAHDKVVKLDRKNKIAITSGGRKVPYDHLLLCTGQQFQLPAPTGVDISELVTTHEALKRKRPQVFNGFVPQNVFLVNSHSHCKEIIDWIENESTKEDGIAIIYGATLEAFVCIQAMLTRGFPGKRIAIVKPPGSGTLCFNNPKVEQKVDQALENLGVTVYNDYTLAQWNDGKKDEPFLYCASFTSDTKPFRTHCKAFFCFHEKKVDHAMFKAINDSCLVYDGKLVIDSCFRTNDPFIKAAGTMTKYARRYHADQWSHLNFNSKEIGAKLAETMLQLFDPTLEGEVRDDPLDDKLIPVFQSPKSTFAMLPGNYHYLHICKPSLPIPLESLMAQPDYGQEMITDTSTADAANYFRIHVNQYKFIETITCLRSEPIDVSNLLVLYGMHQRYLNNLASRFEEGLIDDFYKFFNEPWCLAIYHDRFQDFRTEVRELLSTKMESSLSLEEKVVKMVEEDLVLTKEQREYLLDSFVSSGTKKAIDERLLSFLNYNDYHLPMYAKPGMI